MYLGRNTIAKLQPQKKLYMREEGGWHLRPCEIGAQVCRFSSSHLQAQSPASPEIPVLSSSEALSEYLVQNIGTVQSLCLSVSFLRLSKDLRFLRFCSALLDNTATVSFPGDSPCCHSTHAHACSRPVVCTLEHTSKSTWKTY